MKALLVIALVVGLVLVLSVAYIILVPRVPYMDDMHTGGEKVAIEAVQCTVLNNVSVLAKSVGGNAVNITDAILKDSQGNIVSTQSELSINLPATGEMTTINCTFTGMTSGNSYTVILATKSGGSFVSHSFKAP